MKQEEKKNKITWREKIKKKERKNKERNTKSFLLKSIVWNENERKKGRRRKYKMNETGTKE